MKKVDYDARLHGVYAAGREMSTEALETWMEAFARHSPETRPLVWLDLGSGTGRLTPALADAFGGPVHGVEPSDKMRALVYLQCRTGNRVVVREHAQDVVADALAHRTDPEVDLVAVV